MKFYSNQLNLLIPKIADGKVNALLFHGPNTGLAEIILAQIIKKFSLLVSHYSFKEAKPDILYPKAFETNFFQQKELIKVSEVTPTLSKDLKELLQQEGFSNLLCFIADESLPPSGIRKFFEDSSNLACIACYYEDEQAIAKMALKKIIDAGKNIDEDGLFFLKNHLKGDSKIIDNEIQKLLYYCHDKKLITKADIVATMSSELLASGDDMCIYFASKEYNLFLKEIAKLKEQNINEVLIIRALIRFYINLYIVISQLEDGINIDAALKKVSPPIFFKYIPSFKEITRKISSSDAIKMLEKLNQAEAEYKLNPQGFELYNFLI